MSKVEKLAFVPLVEGPDFIGILGTAIVRVDGMGFGPLIVMRLIDGKVDTSYVVSFSNVEIPACILDPDVRAQIEKLVAQVIADWRAQLCPPDRN